MGKQLRFLVLVVSLGFSYCSKMTSDDGRGGYVGTWAFVDAIPAVITLDEFYKVAHCY